MYTQKRTTLDRTAKKGTPDLLKHRIGVCKQQLLNLRALKFLRLHTALNSKPYLDPMKPTFLRLLNMTALYKSLKR